MSINVIHIMLICRFDSFSEHDSFIIFEPLILARGRYVDIIALVDLSVCERITMTSAFLLLVLSLSVS